MRIAFLAFCFVLPSALAVGSDCRLCHMTKSLKYVPGKHKPAKQHQGFENRHGKTEISCHQCHDANQHNFLRTSAEFPATFESPSPVCQRCHFDIFKDWSRGLHGKRTGHWNGEKKVLACVECHNPHQVPFKAMKADPPPRTPKLGIAKEHE